MRCFIATESVIEAVKAVRLRSQRRRRRSSHSPPFGAAAKRPWGSCRQRIDTVLDHLRVWSAFRRAIIDVSSPQGLEDIVERIQATSRGRNRRTDQKADNRCVQGACRENRRAYQGADCRATLQ